MLLLLLIHVVIVANPCSDTIVILRLYINYYGTCI